MPALQKLILASRQSELALRQTHTVAEALRQSADIAVDILPLSTRGDEITDRPLAEVGGKALFIKGLQQAIADGRAHVAVHSLKDMEAAPTPGFSLAAVGFAADCRDVLITCGNTSPHDLPDGTVVGTCSPRRAALLRRHFPQARAAAVRGNIQTRLGKLQAGEFDALLLAAAALQRLDLFNAADLSILPLPPEQFIPAVGQGLLGVECAADNAEVTALLAPLDDPAARQRATAERAFAAAMHGDCHTALGAHATPNENENGITLRAFYAAPSLQHDGGFFDAEVRAPAAQGAHEAGEKAAAIIQRAVKDAQKTQKAKEEKD